MDLFLGVVDVPQLLMSLLDEDERVLGYFRMLPEHERERLIRYIDDAKTGEEARKRIDEVKELAYNYQEFF